MISARFLSRHFLSDAIGQKIRRQKSTGGSTHRLAPKMGYRTERYGQVSFPIGEHDAKLKVLWNTVARELMHESSSIANQRELPHVISNGAGRDGHRIRLAA